MTGYTYTYLMNGTPPAANWTGLFKPGEKVRLRFINGSAMSLFRRAYPGPEDDGRGRRRPARASGRRSTNFASPSAETYDVIVEPYRSGRFHDLRAVDRPHGLRARHAGGARGPARSSAGARSAPMLTMADMGHGGMDHGAWA